MQVAATPGISVSTLNTIINKHEEAYIFYWTFILKERKLAKTPLEKLRSIFGVWFKQARIMNAAAHAQCIELLKPYTLLFI